MNREQMHFREICIFKAPSRAWLCGENDTVFGITKKTTCISLELHYLQSQRLLWLYLADAFGKGGSCSEYVLWFGNVSVIVDAHYGFFLPAVLHCQSSPGSKALGKCLQHSEALLSKLPPPSSRYTLGLGVKYICIPSVGEYLLTPFVVRD